MTATDVRTEKIIEALTALYPEDGSIYARFCNFSDKDASYQGKPTSTYCATRKEETRSGVAISSSGHETMHKGIASYSIPPLKPRLTARKHSCSTTSLIYFIGYEHPK